MAKSNFFPFPFAKGTVVQAGPLESGDSTGASGEAGTDSARCAPGVLPAARRCSGLTARGRPTGARVPAEGPRRRQKVGGRSREAGPPPAFPRSTTFGEDVGEKRRWRPSAGPCTRCPGAVCSWSDFVRRRKWLTSPSRPAREIGALIPVCEEAAWASGAPGGSSTGLKSTRISELSQHRPRANEYKASS